MTIKVDTDRFGQTIHLCPDCGSNFLTSLPTRPPTNREIKDALDWHKTTCRP